MCEGVCVIEREREREEKEREKKKKERGEICERTARGGKNGKKNKMKTK